MKMMKCYIFLILPIAFYSCKTTDKSTSPESFGNTKSTEIKNTTLNRDYVFDKDKYEFEISGIQLVDSILLIQHSYSGCKDDQVELIFDGKVLKSYPPKAKLYLQRKAGSKNCDKKINTTSSFYLSNIKTGKGKTMIISVFGNDQTVNYNY